jgi:hypothetical protein
MVGADGWTFSHRFLSWARVQTAALLGQQVVEGERSLLELEPAGVKAGDIEDFGDQVGQ